LNATRFALRQAITTLNADGTENGLISLIIQRAATFEELNEPGDVFGTASGSIHCPSDYLPFHVLVAMTR
jgi:hypothetical protein